LRKLAAARLAAEAPGHSLDPTALVHEAYLRLVGDQHFDGRGHFFAAAAEAMRRILVENARRKRSHKHGGDRKRQQLDSSRIAMPEAAEELLALDEALTNLAFAFAAPREAADTPLPQPVRAQDANGNGRIEAGEAQGNIKAQFDLYDADKDGTLNRAEMEAARPLLRQRGIAEAPHHTIGPDVPLEDAFRFLEAEDAERVPVVDEHHRLVGVLSRSVLQRRLAEDEQNDTEPLPPAA
jgi:hypothetical protein